jgi:hypothetical protein
MQSQLMFNIIGFHTLALYLPVAALVLYLRPAMVHHIMALFLGLLTAFIDHHGDEVTFTVLLLLSFGFFLGFSQPSRVWRWAVLISLWVPITAILMIFVEGRNAVFLKDGIASGIALVPAFVGAYGGLFIHSLGSMPGRNIHAHNISGGKYHG